MMRKQSLRHIAVLFFATLVSCGYDSHVNITQEKPPEPAGPSWRDLAIQKKNDEAQIIVPTSKGDGASECPARTICVKAPYIGLLQLSKAAARSGELFAIKNSEKRIVVHLSGKDKEGPLAYYFEADIFDLDSQILLQSDGGNVTVVASEVTGTGMIDTSPTGLEANRSGRGGGKITIFAPTVSRVTLVSNGEDGLKGPDAPRVPPAESGRQETPIINTRRYTYPKVCACDPKRKEQIKICERQGIKLAHPDCMIHLGWTRQQIDELNKKGMCAIISGYYDYVADVQPSPANNGADATYSKAGENGGNAGAGGAISVYYITQAGDLPEATSKGGLGGPGGAGFTQAAGKGASFDYKYNYLMNYDFSCFGLFRAPTFGHSMIPLPATSLPVKCPGGNERRLPAYDSLKIQGKDGRSLPAAPAGAAGKDGVPRQVELHQLSREAFLANLKRLNLHFAEISALK